MHVLIFLGVNELQYKQCRVTPHFPNWQIYGKNMEKE